MADEQQQHTQPADGATVEQESQQLEDTLDAIAATAEAHAAHRTEVSGEIGGLKRRVSALEERPAVAVTSAPAQHRSPIAAYARDADGSVTTTRGGARFRFDRATRTYRREA